MLTKLFFFLSFFFFALESDEDVSDEDNDDEGSGSRLTSGSCLSSCFELSVDHVSGFLFKVVTKSVCHLC